MPGPPNSHVNGQGSSLVGSAIRIQDTIFIKIIKHTAGWWVILEGWRQVVYDGGMSFSTRGLNTISRVL